MRQWEQVSEVPRPWSTGGRALPQVQTERKGMFGVEKKRTFSDNGCHSRRCESEVASGPKVDRGSRGKTKVEEGNKLLPAPPRAHP